MFGSEAESDDPGTDTKRVSASIGARSEHIYIYIDPRTWRRGTRSADAAFRAAVQILISADDLGLSRNVSVPSNVATSSCNTSAWMRTASRVTDDMGRADAALSA